MSFPESDHSSAPHSALDSAAVRARDHTEENGVKSPKAAEEAKADHASATFEPQVREEVQDKLLSMDDKQGIADLSGQDGTVVQRGEAVGFQEMLVSQRAGTVAPKEPAPDDPNLVHEPQVDKFEERVEPDGGTFSVQELHKALMLDPSPLPLPPQSTVISAPRPTEDNVTNPVASARHTPDLEQVVKEQRDGGKPVEDDSQSEIQSILDQFDEKGSGSGSGSVERKPTSGLVPNASSHPPRKSSLEPLGPGSPLHGNGPPVRIPVASYSSSYFSDTTEPDHTHGQHKLSGMGSVNSLDYPRPGHIGSSGANGPSSPISAASLHKSLPPVPDPEPDLPFDFHRFLEQLRHRTADPVAKFLRSFLIEFGKKQWMVHEQVKIISDFLTFITGKMAQCEVWREISDAEFDNAKEGMEKLVMNRLYSQTFSPAIPPPVPIPPAKGKRKIVQKALGPGRQGQHQEDIERDEVLAQKVRIYSWVREEHLDIAPVGDSGRRFLSLAQQGDPENAFPVLHCANRWAEILKIKTYRAPRDKVICVLNCCKVIFGMPPLR